MCGCPIRGGAGGGARRRAGARSGGGARRSARGSARSGCGGGRRRRGSFGGWLPGTGLRNGKLFFLLGFHVVPIFLGLVVVVLLFLVTIDGFALALVALLALVVGQFGHYNLLPAWLHQG